ncbi:SsgA family sporulation/cell division regulator [Streptomyces sp. WI04-05B]|uniref:SsgA family sporulation/cell division regulator n=1 Tax=Streptomyces TaxID=1883 RepID=UPI0029B969C8|nr:MULTISPECIES: SsgA family sporulation/cell division regulator [unclassified Streptomyces]MDX2543079.1 SsgA family sporulation/cell division regulator [Streptomyces sp. WI04-05B]MDX2584880.1 SsgA family sporulation/cell division regulator [Streptomyces sp. WI04-05A]
MYRTLEQSARARLITPGYQELPLVVTLRYDSADPLAVHLDFPEDVSVDGERVTWTFSRLLLGEGLDNPAGIGEVHLWPCGPTRTVIELHSPYGLAVIRFRTAQLQRFLHRSYGVVAPGMEDLAPAVERGLALLLGGV